MYESEIPEGPRLALALRARRWLLLLGAALGFAAAGSTVAVGAQRGATSAYLAMQGSECWRYWSWESCPDSWWEWPADKSPWDSPPTAVLPGRRRDI